MKQAKNIEEYLHFKKREEALERRKKHLHHKNQQVVQSHK